MVSLEDLQKEMIQGFASVNAKIDSTVGAAEARLDARIDRLEAKMDAGFARVDEQFARVDEQFARVDEQFARVDEQLAYVRQGLLDHNKEFQEIRSALDKKVDRDEVEAIVERAVARAMGS